MNFYFLRLISFLITLYDCYWLQNNPFITQISPKTIAQQTNNPTLLFTISYYPEADSPEADSL
jgi:hypothetical protein